MRRSSDRLSSLHVTADKGRRFAEFLADPAVRSEIERREAEALAIVMTPGVGDADLRDAAATLRVLRGLTTLAGVGIDAGARAQQKIDDAIYTIATGMANAE